ncbi:MAG: peptidoglycan recognition family protein [Candidatus Wallbacteria bacterium]|nr:peptidoglycan recognition family protein [Candidatus Wallbacteria bacterium]
MRKLLTVLFISAVLNYSATAGNPEAAKMKITRERADYPGAFADFTPINHLKFRIHKPDTIVIHWVGEGTAAGAVRWFLNPDSRVSAHFIINQTGEVVQMVKLRDTAWHCTRRIEPLGGMNNPRTIGIEHEATWNNPELWFTDSMLKASADLVRFLCEKYQIPMRFGSPGILGHSNMPGCLDKNCPGNFPWERFWFYLTGKDRLDFTPYPNEEKPMPAKVVKKSGLLQKPDLKSKLLRKFKIGDQILLTGQYKEWYTAKPANGDSIEGFVLDSDVWFSRRGNE